MYFSSPCHKNWSNIVVSTDELQKIVHNKFSFRYANSITITNVLYVNIPIKFYSIPDSVNPQTFLQNHCDYDNISQVTRYKIRFKIFSDDASSLVKAGCHIEEQGDTFTHVWTRISVEDEIKDAWRDVKKVDIICPGR